MIFRKKKIRYPQIFSDFCEKKSIFRTLCSEIVACSSRFDRKEFEISYQDTFGRVCNKVGACAARFERMRRGQSVCSEVKACVAALVNIISKLPLLISTIS